MPTSAQMFEHPEVLERPGLRSRILLLIIAVPLMMIGCELLLIKYIKSSSSNADLQGLVCLPW